MNYIFDFIKFLSYLDAHASVSVLTWFDDPNVLRWHL